MQVRIVQSDANFGPMTSQIHGKWYACTGSGFEAEYFNKTLKFFQTAINKTEDGYSNSAGLMAHMVKQAYPHATIIIEPTKVTAKS